MPIQAPKNNISSLNINDVKTLKALKENTLKKSSLTDQQDTDPKKNNLNTKKAFFSKKETFQSAKYDIKASANKAKLDLLAEVDDEHNNVETEDALKELKKPDTTYIQTKVLDLASFGSTIITSDLDYTVNESLTIIVSPEASKITTTSTNENSQTTLSAQKSSSENNDSVKLNSESFFRSLNLLDQFNYSFNHAKKNFYKNDEEAKQYLIAAREVQIHLVNSMINMYKSPKLIQTAPGSETSINDYLKSPKNRNQFNLIAYVIKNFHGLMQHPLSAAHDTNIYPSYSSKDLDKQLASKPALFNDIYQQDLKQASSLVFAGLKSIYSESESKQIFNELKLISADELAKEQSKSSASKLIIDLETQACDKKIKNSIKAIEYNALADAPHGKNFQKQYAKAMAVENLYIERMMDQGEKAKVINKLENQLLTKVAKLSNAGGLMLGEPQQLSKIDSSYQAALAGDLKPLIESLPDSVISLESKAIAEVRELSDDIAAKKTEVLKEGFKIYQDLPLEAAVSYLGFIGVVGMVQGADADNPLLSKPETFKIAATQVLGEWLEHSGLEKQGTAVKLKKSENTFEKSKYLERLAIFMSKFQELSPELKDDNQKKATASKLSKVATELVGLKKAQAMPVADKLIKTEILMKDYLNDQDSINNLEQTYRKFIGEVVNDFKNFF
jgi:hypothetical protein